MTIHTIVIESLTLFFHQDVKFRYFVNDGYQLQGILQDQSCWQSCNFRQNPQKWTSPISRKGDPVRRSPLVNRAPLSEKRVPFFIIKIVSYRIGVPIEEKTGPLLVKPGPLAKQQSLTGTGSPVMDNGSPFERSVMPFFGYLTVWGQNDNYAEMASVIICLRVDNRRSLYGSQQKNRLSSVGISFEPFGLSIFYFSSVLSKPY